MADKPKLAVLTDDGRIQIEFMSGLIYLCLELTPAEARSLVSEIIEGVHNLTGETWVQSKL